MTRASTSVLGLSIVQLFLWLVLDVLVEDVLVEFSESDVVLLSLNMWKLAGCCCCLAAGAIVVSSGFSAV